MGGEPASQPAVRETRQEADMKTRTLLMVIAFAAIAAFVALNWGAITTTTSLSLGVTTVQAPLGFLLLALLALFTILFVVFVIYSRTSGFFKERDHSREMKATQELADNAETSRFTELRELLGPEFKKHTDLYSATTATVMARLEQLDGLIRSVTRDPRIVSLAPVKSLQLAKQKEQS
jgi:flagellar biosynthesis/type III secretory pathway M-ring protein FliF/YscJ